MATSIGKVELFLFLDVLDMMKIIYLISKEDLMLDILRI